MIETVEAGDKQVSVRAVVNAPASEIFALLANPHRHSELDGSGTVGANISGPERLALGGKFSTHMQQGPMKYRTTSTVTQFADDRVIEWQVGAGQKWRYELVPTAGGGTEVTETWDVREVPGVVGFGFKLTGMYGRNAKGMEETLRKLQQRFGGVA